MIANPRRDCCAQMGLQRQLLLAKALRGKQCAGQSVEAAVEMRVQGKNGVVVVVVDV